MPSFHLSGIDMCMSCQCILGSVIWFGFYVDPQLSVFSLLLSFFFVLSIRKDAELGLLNNVGNVGITSVLLGMY